VGEREPNKEILEKGELFYLWHPETADTFSGYGLTLEANRKDRLAGLLMVDRPQPADPDWLKDVQDMYGECQLIPMTAAGERGLACQMQIEEEDIPHLRRFPSEKSNAIQMALEPLLKEPPAPVLNMSWDEESRTWRSELAVTNELSPELREVFEHIGYGCLAVETDIGIVHVCHASDADTESAVKVLDKLELATFAAGLGGVRTTTQVPATMAFLDISPEQRAQMNISDGMIRVSAGLEDAADLKADFDQALAAI
jgi:hypothetical protein